MCLLLRSGFRLATLLSGRFSHLHRGTLELCQSDHHFPDQGPSPRLLSLARQPALGRVLVVPNFFHFRMIEATVLGDLQCCRNVLVPIARSVPWHNSVSSSTNYSFNLMASFFLWIALSTVTLHIVWCVPFQIMSNQLNLPVGFQSSCRNIKDYQCKQDAPEFNFESHSKGSEY